MSNASQPNFLMQTIPFKHLHTCRVLQVEVGHVQGVEGEDM